MEKVVIITDKEAFVVDGRSVFAGKVDDKYEVRLRGELSSRMPVDEEIKQCWRKIMLMDIESKE